MNNWIAADWSAPPCIIAGTTVRSHDESALPAAGKPCWLKQVHGAAVVSAGPFDSPPEADGSTNGTAGYFCVVSTADCVPVLMCSANGSAFGVAHAGWRGLAAGVIENTIARLDAAPCDLHVWLGPAISQASFEVGAEVREVFMDYDASADVCFDANPRGRWQADLYGLARQRLLAAGVSSVFGGGYCTYLDRQRFHSYRRDPGCGRLLSFVGLKTP